MSASVCSLRPWGVKSWRAPGRLGSAAKSLPTGSSRMCIHNRTVLTMRPDVKSIKYVVAVILCAVFAPPLAHGQGKIKVAYPTTVGSMAVLWVAKEAKLFDKYGLEVELIYIAGSSRVVQAMLAKEIPISEIAIPAVIQANLAGADLVMLAGPNHKPGQKIMVKPEIKTPENLKGKRTGLVDSGPRMISYFVTYWGSGRYSRTAMSPCCKWEDRRRFWRDWVLAGLTVE